ncbi:hypothetical protein DFJ74DRAFT_644180 [Hyaloraphidium curvatum]|nr:hypothetical protein DFJ74DRAFT_644180 [Hyaloraphidium curvatum]
MGVIRADAALLNNCVHFGPKSSMYIDAGGPGGLRDAFLCLRLVLARIANASGRVGAGSNDLAAVIDAVQSSHSAVRERRAFVLLMLFFGAGGPGPMLAKIRKGTNGIGATRYRGLMDDVLEVARWKKRIAHRSIGGLPPEITQEIMFQTWIGMLRAGPRVPPSFPPSPPLKAAMFPEYHVLHRALSSGEAPPVIVAAATGDVDALRNLVPPCDASDLEERLDAPRDAKMEDSEAPEGFDDAYSATELAAAGNHTTFLEALGQLAGPFCLEKAFKSALWWFADRTIAWMLQKAARLVPADADDAWHSILLDRGRAKDFLVHLGNRDDAFNGDLPLGDPETNGEACRRCYRALYGGSTDTCRCWLPFFGKSADTWDPHRAPMHFMRMLRDFFPDDFYPRREIATWALPTALKRWRHSGVLRLLLDMDLVRADASLLSVCLDLSAFAFFPSSFPWRRDEFLSFRLLLSRITAASGGPGAEPHDLAVILSQVRAARSIISGRRSFILLLIFYGAGGGGPAIRRARATADADRHPGLMEDVLEVARWKRWIADRSIGGLVPEINSGDPVSNLD